jgi:glucose/arabinose dehydrogenase
MRRVASARILSVMNARTLPSLLAWLALVPMAACSSSDDGSSGDQNDGGADAGGDVLTTDSGVHDGNVGDSKTDGTPTDSTPPPDGVVDGSDTTPPACDPVVLPKLKTTPIAGSHTFDQPVFVTQAKGDDTRLYVVEQKGTIQIVKGGAVNAAPFLDITATIAGAPSDERGLLGLAFAPDYATSGRFFVGYTAYGGAAAGHNIVAEYKRGADADHADPTEVARLASTDDPESNHDGGWVGFGPDGFLYAGIGDGGGGCDEHGTNGNGQNKNTLLGKMLRLDINNASGGYAAAGNPFSGASGLPQIWAWGLRNPWRPSFDMATGDFYIADVGQNMWEEIDVQPASSKGGENYGWREREGRHPSSDSGCSPVVPTPTGLTEPVFDFPHGPGDPIGGSAIMGGYVYRGTAIPGIVGAYFFGDYGSGEVATFRWCGGSTITKPIKVDDLSGVVSGLDSWGQDNAGEIYMTAQDGNVLKVVPGP